MTDTVDEADVPDDAAPDGADDPGHDDPGPDDSDVASDETVPGRSRTGLIVSLVVALLVVAFVGVLATREPATERRSTSPLIGKVAPALQGETLDGGTFDIDDHRGEWVVVNFFATWCGPCVEEHPELIAFDEAHRAAGDATVVSVVYDDDPGDVADFFAERGGEWPVVRDGGLAPVDYGVVKVPETYLVTPAGDVAQKYIGGVTREMIDSDIAAIEAAVAERSEGDGS